MKRKHIAYLAYGSNLGDKENNITQAYRLTEQKVGRMVKHSTLMHSEPWGFESANAFVNSVAEVETTLSPHELLRATQQIEREMGRTRKSKNGEYHDRIIDIDILLYDDVSINDSDLVIPHPLMRERDFVMQPLKEIYDITQF